MGLWSSPRACDPEFMGADTRGAGVDSAPRRPLRLRVIYLDNNATTRPAASVAEAVSDALTRWWHNPSSIHRPGQEARQHLELARRDVASLINARPRDIVFTSSGTEAIDMAIRGTLSALGRQAPSPIVVSTRIEHAAVRELLEHLQRTGEAEIRWAPVSRNGMVELESLPELLQGAALATIQWCNNETGAIQPVIEIGQVCREHHVVFHCDAVQWIGKHPADVEACPVDILSFSPHKFHGPKGVGINWFRRGTRIRPTVHGTQELGRRGGTENVPGILGAGAACREAAQWLSAESGRAHIAALRDRFEHQVLSSIPDAQVNGPRDHRRTWNTTNIGFPRLEAEALLLMLSERGICASAGAACSSGSLDPSPVLLAIGCPPELAHGSLRFSLSRETTEAEVAAAATVVVECVQRLRQSLGITA